MIQKNKCIVIDIDGTICKEKKSGESYSDILPDSCVVERLHEYKAMGFHIILYTSRNMNSYEGNIGLINANTAKIMLSWLEKHNIPFDEIHYGKPWCGFEGFYVDDKCIRPKEFLEKNYEEIINLINEK